MKSKKKRLPARQSTATTPIAPATFASHLPDTSEVHSPALVGNVAVGIFVATLFLFWPATQHEFVNFDDNIYVTDNTQVRRGLTPETIAWAFRSTEFSNWHPLTWLSHMLDVSIWGVSPESAFGHHLTNVVLHAVNASLVFVVWYFMTHRLWPSVLLAMLFAWHPLRVESVAWVAERKDLLSGCFWLLTMAAYWYYTCRVTSHWRYLAMVGCFALGLMAKPMLVTLPFALLLLDFWPLRRLHLIDGRLPDHRTLWPLLREKLPLFALAVASSAITYFAQSTGGAVAGQELPFDTRLANALMSYQTYLAQTIWPANLAVFYPIQQDSIPWGQVAFALLLLSAVSALAYALRNRLSFLPVGWLWYLGTLVPVIGLVQVGGQAHADRYTYIPSIGIALIVAWGVAELIVRRPQVKAVSIVAAALVLLMFATSTRLQIRHWSDSVALFRRATEVSPHSVVAWFNLGGALLATGDPEQAVASYQQAYALVPAPEIEAGLATALASAGDVSGSIAIMQAQLARDPENPRLANNLAWVFATQPDLRYRDPSEAVRLAEVANRQTGDNDPVILDTLAAAYASAGRFDEAVRTAERAISQANYRNDPVMARSIDERRQLYKAQQPYYEEAAFTPSSE